VRLPWRSWRVYGPQTSGASAVSIDAYTLFYKRRAEFSPPSPVRGPGDAGDIGTGISAGAGAGAAGGAAGGPSSSPGPGPVVVTQGQLEDALQDALSMLGLTASDDAVRGGAHVISVAYAACTCPPAHLRHPRACCGRPRTRRVAASRWLFPLRPAPIHPLTSARLHARPPVAKRLCATFFECMGAVLRAL
jgi:hypothetical protein